MKTCLKVRDIRKKIKSLPKTLDDTYARILTNIDDKYQKEATVALKFLAFAERALSIDELVEAMIIKPRSDNPFSPEDRFLIHTISF